MLNRTSPYSDLVHVEWNSANLHSMTLSKDMVMAQSEYYRQQMQLPLAQGLWQGNANPGALAISVERDSFGPGQYRLDFATSMVQGHGENPPAPVGVFHPSLYAIDSETGNTRYYTTGAPNRFNNGAVGWTRLMVVAMLKKL